MATIRQVAEKAGVSLTTVSHVINNTRFVSDEARQRVLAAMKELGYQPNALARSLRRGETHTLGLVLPDSANPFFAEIGHSIEATAFQQAYNVILCNTEGDQEKEISYVEVLVQKQVDGIIFVAAGEDTDYLQALIERGMPVVVVDRDLPGLQVDAVLTDNWMGGCLATRHLTSLGHRRIGCIAGPLHLSPSKERVAGFRETLQEAGITPDPDLVVGGDFHPDQGRRAALQLLRQRVRPTALFACNDLMAMGALRAISELGMRVPQDVAVVGFDDIDLASYTTPPLTTISQPKAKIGRTAVRLLLERITGRDRPVVRELLPISLTVRQSSGGA